MGGVIIIDDACQQPGNAPSGIRPKLEASDLALRTQEEEPLINPTQQHLEPTRAHTHMMHDEGINVTAGINALSSVFIN